MEHNEELLREREYTAHVQQLLYAVINQSEDFNDRHSQTIRALLSDAWEELRLKPTALSEKDLEQLSILTHTVLGKDHLTRIINVHAHHQNEHGDEKHQQGACGNQDIQDALDDMVFSVGNIYVLQVLKLIGQRTCIRRIRQVTVPPLLRDWNPCYEQYISLHIIASDM